MFFTLSIKQKQPQLFLLTQKYFFYLFQAYNIQLNNNLLKAKDYLDIKYL
jgi:hypothetical protein